MLGEQEKRLGLGVNVVSLRCDIEAVSKVFLPPYAGATFRGILGQALRRRSCVTKQATCLGCAVKGQCVYGVLWEASAEGGAQSGKHAEIPKGYVIEAPSGRREQILEKGERLGLRILLFGSATELATQVLEALAEGVRRGVGSEGGLMLLTQALVEEGDTGVEVRLYAEGRRVVALNPLPTRWIEIPKAEISPSAWDQTCRVELEAETPLHLIKNGQMIKQFDPFVFTVRLVERLELIAAFYEKAVIERGLCSDLIAKARDVRVEDDSMQIINFNRFSNRSQGRIPMSGLLGRATVANVPARLLALWRLARYLHVGKQATFGFGKVCVLRAISD